MTGRASWCLRVAGANGIVNGLGFGGFTIPAMVSVGQAHGILYTFGNPTYGNGPFERIEVPTSVPLLAAFLAACVVQVVGGVLLLWPRRSGIVVSIVGLLLCAPFWWGFDLPFAWLNAAVLLGLLVLDCQHQHRPTSAGTSRDHPLGRLQLVIAEAEQDVTDKLDWIHGHYAQRVATRPTHPELFADGPLVGTPEHSSRGCARSRASACPTRSPTSSTRSRPGSLELFTTR